MLFPCRALLAFQRATDFPCSQEIKIYPVVNTGRKEWLLGTAGLVLSSRLMLHLVIQRVVLSWPPSWSISWRTAVCGDTSTSVPLLFLAAALHPCWWSRSTTTVSPLSMRLVGWGVLLTATHMCMVRQFEWVLLNPNGWIALRSKENKMSYLKEQLRRISVSHCMSFSAECFKYRMSPNVLLTFGQSYW